MNWYKKVESDFGPPMETQAETVAQSVLDYARRISGGNGNQVTTEVGLIRTQDKTGNPVRITVVATPTKPNGLFSGKFNPAAKEFNFVIPAGSKSLPPLRQIAAMMITSLKNEYQKAPTPMPANVGGGYNNRFDPTGSARAKGDAAEQEFKETYRKLGHPQMPQISKLFADPQRRAELDRPPFFLDDGVSIGGRNTFVQIKAQKTDANRRGTDDWTLIEFKNVNGKDGWLYPRFDIMEKNYGLKFDQKRVIFEQSDKFILVDLDDLKRYAQQVFDVASPTSDKATAMSGMKGQNGRYKTYARFDRPEERVGYLRTSELLQNVKHEKWPKANVAVPSY